MPWITLSHAHPVTDEIASPNKFNLTFRRLVEALSSN